MITKEEIIEALKKVEDPELFLDIWFLGLIYSIEIEGAKIKIEMTFTSPMCPVGPQLVEEVQQAVKSVEGVEAVEVRVTFNPPWEPSEDVRAMLGMM